jgi:hypothetical protein
MLRNAPSDRLGGENAILVVQAASISHFRCRFLVDRAVERVEQGLLKRSSPSPRLAHDLLTLAQASLSLRTRFIRLMKGSLSESERRVTLSKGLLTLAKA